jgi:hypothetical protein
MHSSSSFGSADLAVIFRPGIISHPDHEMSPREHDLSQKVLEFLIAQQDWFMLDIPPPPRPLDMALTSPKSVDEDILVHPSSDEESPVGGGWKHVGTQSKRITRRRTHGALALYYFWNVTDDDGEYIEELDEAKAAGSDDLSPVAESPVPLTGAESSSGATGVTRSHTLPSVKGSIKDAPGDDKQQRARVLRKQKRASSHQPRSEYLSSP